MSARSHTPSNSSDLIDPRAGCAIPAGSPSPPAIRSSSRSLATLLMTRLRQLRLRQWLKRLGDGALLFGAYYAAFALRFEGELPPEYWHTFAYSAPLVVLTKLILLHHFGAYRCCWRYISVRELASLAKALSLGTLLITADYAIAVGFVSFPRSIILFDWCLSLLALAGFRALPASAPRPAPRWACRCP